MSTGPGIAVVGTCAAGKSTVVARLNAEGFRAWAVAQEHSGVSKLWDHMHPDFLIYLDTTLDDVRRRRGDPGWPEWIFDEQQKRLQDAREHADLVVQTSAMSVEAVVERIVEAIRERVR